MTDDERYEEARAEALGYELVPDDDGNDCPYCGDPYELCECREARNEWDSLTTGSYYDSVEWDGTEDYPQPLTLVEHWYNLRWRVVCFIRDLLPYRCKTCGAWSWIKNRCDCLPF